MKSGHAVCLVGPDASTPSGSLDRLKRFWTELGANVVEMTVPAHARILAQTSHLPHVAAAALAGLLADEDRPFVAGGFRDTTRIAAGDPDLWVGILLNNAGEVVRRLDPFAMRLSEFRAALINRDSETLKKLLHNTKIRAHFKQSRRKDI